VTYVVCEKVSGGATREWTTDVIFQICLLSEEALAVDGVSRGRWVEDVMD
jgi:hypothetical protein